MTRKLLTILALLLMVPEGTWAQSTSDIGKVLAADGKMYKTVAAATNAGTTASGIIAYWGKAGSVESGNSSYRGMAIALKDAVLTWGSRPNHMEYCTSTSHQCSTATPYCSTASAAVNAKNGIAATQSAITNNGEGHWHNAAGNGDGVALPSGASGWAIPSIGQWNLMAQGLTGNSSNLSDTDNPDYHYNNLSTKINAAGGTHLEWLFYWSSTEKDAGNVWCFNIGGLDYGRNGSRASSFAKNHNDEYMHVRMFFAFSSATAAVYTISYNANGGSGAPSNQTKDGGIDLTLSSTAPTRSGFAFAGWNTKADGSGTSYASGATFRGNANTTLYAQWNFQGSGSSTDPYLIPSADVWNFLADQVSAGNTYYDKYFQLTEDVCVTTMVGNSESNSFRGTFDGDGHTLTFNKGTAESPFAENSCAPFRHVKNATIKNLHAAGTIYTSAMRAGGLVADSHGALTLAGCRSSVNINSGKSGDGTHGGLVAITTGSSNTVTIGGCVFDGSFATTSSTNSCGGFVGWTGENTPAITNSLMKPGCVAAGMLNNTFARWQSGYEPTITNCYYVATDNLPVDQGTQAYAFATAPANLGSLVQDYDMLKAYANGILYDGIYYVAPIISLTDGDNLSALATWAGKTCAVTYTRSFTSGKPSTVCLPFAYTKKEGDGLFYAFTGIEKENGSGEYIATMTDPSESTLTANTPYLYMPSATGSMNFSGTYTIPAELTAGSTTSGDWTFKGTFATIEWTTAPTTPTYGFSAQDANDGITQGQFVKVGAYVRVKPMRCYLEYNGSDSPFAGTRGTSAEANEQLPETIKVRLIGANGDITAIGTLHTQTGEIVLDGWYTLDGTRLTGQPTRKGIYVNNGKKVIIK